MAKAFSTNVTIVLIELVYLQKNRSNIPFMDFLLTSPYNGFSNHPPPPPPSGIFTNKFLHVSINNKIIFINKKKHTHFLIVLQKSQTTK
jgi:hypothetical protein